MEKFDHEKLDVYQIAIEFVAIADNIIENPPRGRSYLADQFQRAATSICLNIAESAGEYSKNEKARFYRMAKRSATECAAIMDVCSNLNIVENEIRDKGRELLLRIVSMLVKMVKR